MIMAAMSIATTAATSQQQFLQWYYLPGWNSRKLPNDMFLEKHSGSGSFRAGQKEKEARLQTQLKSPNLKGTEPNIIEFKGPV